MLGKWRMLKKSPTNIRRCSPLPVDPAEELLAHLRRQSSVPAAAIFRGKPFRSTEIKRA